MEPIELEHAGWRSLCDGTGHEFYGDVMRDDAVMILANGTLMTRDEVVGSLEQAPPWASYEIAGESTIDADEDDVVLTYVGTGHRDDGSSFTGVMASHYHHDGERWRLVVYQQTEIPPA